jgi:hypothetical protein
MCTLINPLRSLEGVVPALPELACDDRRGYEKRTVTKIGVHCCDLSSNVFLLYLGARSTLWPFPVKV